MFVFPPVGKQGSRPKKVILIIVETSIGPEFLTQEGGTTVVLL